MEAPSGLITNGFGVTVLSDMVNLAWSLEGWRLEAKPLFDPAPDLELGLIWNAAVRVSSLANALHQVLITLTSLSEPAYLSSKDVSKIRRTLFTCSLSSDLISFQFSRKPLTALLLIPDTRYIFDHSTVFGFHPLGDINLRPALRIGLDRNGSSYPLVKQPTPQNKVKTLCALKSKQAPVLAF